LTPIAPEPPESAEPASGDRGQASGEAAPPEHPPTTGAGDAPPASLDHPTEAQRSRADVQAELREAHKTERKERKHKHRWRRRSIWAVCTIVVLAGIGVGSVYLYAKYRYDQIKKIHAKHLVAQSADPLKPFNILLVGSDSRAFVGENQTLSNELGNEGNAGGQRSDVTMVARFDPAAKTVTVLSIPRDLWVDIHGGGTGIEGMNRINAAYDSGPDLLVHTIEQDLGITINHYVSVGFPGFSGMVDALGGITLDFPTAVKDAYTGLDVTQTGCQQVNGVEALQLVRSRHLEYMNSDGYWEYDGLSDFSRIQRQDAFFRAVLAKVNASITNPLAVNAFIGASVGNLTIDDTLTEGDLFNIAQDFRGLPTSHLITETLPTTSLVTDGGADVLQEAQPYAQNMINAFNAIGTTPPATPVAKSSSTTTTTTTTTLPHGEVGVDVLNASSVNGLAHTMAAALASHGFTIDQVGNATTALSSTGSEILYGPDGLREAQTLDASLHGPVTLVATPSLSGSTVQLLVAGTALTVATPSANGGSSGNSGSAAGTSTSTSTSSTTTTTTIPGDVYTNTQAEPWNPYPCTLGATTQAAPKTPTTVKGKSKK
jgi:LCP family protein required for cell wall assembly